MLTDIEIAQQTKMTPITEIAASLGIREEELDMEKLQNMPGIVCYLVQPGDTLWDIAENTMTSEYDSVTEYVQVLKDMNDLQSDDIQAGQHLIIAYNDTQAQ